MKKTFIFILVLLFSIGESKSQVTATIPSDFPTIQSAIDYLINGDTILVSPGEYFENINFRGKDLFITSQYHQSNDRSDIENTIINGSSPTHVDSASCVTIINEETQNAVLKGFTLTGGTGTRTYNSNENLYFRTGGGILIDHASPTIIDNIIVGNESVNLDNVTGAGGGGMRVGNGIPIIRRNYIKSNTGRYAGGVMLAYCEGAVFEGNVVAYNNALGDFNGGGGIYLDWKPVSFLNNTVVFNHSGDDGGGMIITGCRQDITNCIFYGNTAESTSPQIYERNNGRINMTYSDIEGGNEGVGNFDQLPEFEDTINFYLPSTSPCVDAGNPNEIYYDTEDPLNPGMPLYPASGTLRNDVGAFGGPNMHDDNIVILSDENLILSFRITSILPFVFGEINNVENTIELVVPEGTDVTNLTTSFGISNFAEVSIPSGIPMDFTDTVHYIVTAQNGDERDYSVFVSFEPESIKSVNGKKSDNQIIIFPNPTNDFIHIRTSEIKEERIENCRVINSLGEILIEKTDLYNSQKLDVSKLAKGTYFIIVNKNNNQYNGMFQKQ